MNKWLRRAAGTVGLAGGFLVLASGAAQADEATPNASLPASPLLHNIFTPLGTANLGLSLDVPGTRLDAGLLPDGPLSLVPNDGRVGVTAHTLTKNGQPQDVFLNGKLPDVLHVLPIDGLLPPGVFGPVTNAASGTLGNLSNTVSDTTHTIAGFNSPAAGVQNVSGDVSRTLVGGESAPATEGLPVVGPLLGNLPVVGGLLGDNGPLANLPIVGGLLGSGGGLPVVGGLTGGLPVVGGLTQSLGENAGMTVSDTVEQVANSTDAQPADVQPTEGLPLVGGLVGSLPLVGGLIGNLPVVGGLLGDDGSAGNPLSSLPVVGGLTQTPTNQTAPAAPVVSPLAPVAQQAPQVAAPAAPSTGKHAAPVHHFADPAASGQRPVAAGQTSGFQGIQPTLGDPTSESTRVTEDLPVVGSLPVVGPLVNGATSGGGLPVVGSLPVVGPLVNGAMSGGLISSLPLPLGAVRSLPLVGSLIP
jgi:hypothetical protein